MLRLLALILLFFVGAVAGCASAPSRPPAPSPEELALARDEVATCHSQGRALLEEALLNAHWSKVTIDRLCNQGQDFDKSCAAIDSNMQRFAR